MASVTYLLSEFRDKDAVASAIHSLRAAGLDKATFWVSSEADLFSFKTPKAPVSFDTILA